MDTGTGLRYGDTTERLNVAIRGSSMGTAVAEYIGGDDRSQQPNQNATIRMQALVRYCWGASRW